MGLDAPGDPQLIPANSRNLFYSSELQILAPGSAGFACCVRMTDTEHYLLIGAMLTTGAYLIWLAMLSAGL